MLDVAIVLLVLGALGAGTYATLNNRAIRRTRRVLRKARVVPIAELVDGQLACIVGRVEIDGDPVEALVTRQHCVAFDTTTTVLGSEMMVTVRVTRRMTPFFVVDETGRARVDAPEVALCNRPIAKGETYEERVLENGARIRIVGSVSLDPTLASTDQLFRQGAYKARLTGTAKYPLLADVED